MKTTYGLECLYTALHSYAPVKAGPVIVQIRHAMELDGATEHEMALAFAEMLVESLRFGNWAQGGTPSK